MVGRNIVHSLVVFFIVMLFLFTMMFTSIIFLLLLVRWLDVVSVFSVLGSSITPQIVDPILPGGEILCLIFPFLCPWECFRVSMGDILSALCDIKMYRTPIKTMSHDTVKYRIPS